MTGIQGQEMHGGWGIQTTRILMWLICIIRYFEVANKFRNQNIQTKAWLIIYRVWSSCRLYFNLDFQINFIFVSCKLYLVQEQWTQPFWKLYLDLDGLLGVLGMGRHGKRSLFYPFWYCSYYPYFLFPLSSNFLKI